LAVPRGSSYLPGIAGNVTSNRGAVYLDDVADMGKCPGFSNRWAATPTVAVQNNGVCQSRQQGKLE
jgi:hypothetical protein